MIDSSMSYAEESSFVDENESLIFNQQNQTVLLSSNDTYENNNNMEMHLIMIILRQ